MREVYAGGKDILLSEGNGRNKSKGNGVRLRNKKRAQAGSRNNI